MKLIKYYKKTIFFINPINIKYCLKPTNEVEFTHFKLDKTHPHAGINRGFFSEENDGYIKINSSNWDLPGTKFEDLLEYIALNEHFKGKKKWRDSRFAYRIFKYIISGNIKKNFNSKHSRWKTSKFNKKLLHYLQTNNKIRENDVKKILIHREYEIEKLFENIHKYGMKACTKLDLSNNFTNNISVNISKKKTFFNYRGHHRLSIAKILRLKIIPIKITVVKSSSTFREFLSKHDYIKIK